jgi:hypothetical protein
MTTRTHAFNVNVAVGRRSKFLALGLESQNTLVAKTAKLEKVCEWSARFVERNPGVRVGGAA